MVLAMVTGCFRCFGDRQSAAESKRKKDLEDVSMSVDLSSQLNDITVRIVHAGGREERYSNAIMASQLLTKYPRMCIALPDVFRNPHESILQGEEWLLPGQKYYLIPNTTAQKLKRKQSVNTHQGNQTLVEGKAVNGDYSAETVCSADFHVSMIKSRKSRGKRYKRGKAFVAPIQKPRICRDGWEPSLTSVQEISL